MNIVVCKLPRAGLGNQLFPLMKAYVFAYLNESTVMVTNFRQIRIGAYIRGEKSKRQYNGYFNFQKNFLMELDNWRRITFSNAIVIHEPRLERLSSSDLNKSYLFDSVPNWSNYFEQLKGHRHLVKNLLFTLLRNEVKVELENLKAPIIGVHIRMGDFRKLKENEIFSEVGAVRTPLDYFISIIRSIRLISGHPLQVSVFTDGFRHELSSIFELDNIVLIEGNRDIVDLLLLSKSKIIITSAGSTFSYWAGFLSDVPIIMHPDHIHEPLRSNKEIEMYEGMFDLNNPKLIEYIKNIQ